MIYQQVTLSGDAEWPKVADAVIEALGIDIAKRVFHAVGMDERGKIVLRVVLQICTFPPCVSGC
jgi:hypothetical protein